MAQIPSHRRLRRDQGIQQHAVHAQLVKLQGAQLRRLLELLDGELEDFYVAQGLEYRPRYTPVVRALMPGEPLTVGERAKAAGLSQPAAAQTLALVLKQGGVQVSAQPDDGRKRMMRLSQPLSALFGEAIAALEGHSLSQRRAQAAAAAKPGSGMAD